MTWDMSGWYPTRRLEVHTTFHHGIWFATLEGWEPGDPKGEGGNEAEAVMELYMEIADREEQEELRHQTETGAQP